MRSTWELKEHSTGILTTTVTGEVWTQAQAQAFKKIAQKVQMPGFRKGKVPAHLLKRAVNPQSVLYEAIDAIATDALREAVEEQSLEIVGRPSLDIEEMNEESVTLKFEVAIKPEVTLGEYKQLDVKKAAVTISDDEVNQRIKAIQERNAEFIIKDEDGTVENGDTAVIDFEGFQDGVAFAGGSGNDYPLEIGSGSFIPGFEEQLIGMKAQETKEIQVTFPQEYQAEELAGKDATFKVSVHEIKYKELPQFDDEMVKEQKIEGVESVEAFKEYTLNQLSEQKEQEADQAFTNELLTKIVENAQMDIPQVMIDEECDQMINEFANNLKSQGYSLDAYMSVTQMSMESMREHFSLDAKNKISARLVLEAIAKAENIEVGDDEMDAEMEAIAARYGMELEQIKQLIAKDAIAYDLRMRKALTLIKETAGK
ncbi:MAG: trigger factor [Erysipelotrichaceae bacterium]|nr:trigger factor [Erysipelotrichaceae bacterium]MCI9312539.1 trigger factor [Erysipelotrichaceae bacterium]